MESVRTGYDYSCHAEVNACSELALADGHLVNSVRAFAERAVRRKELFTTINRFIVHV